MSGPGDLRRDTPAFHRNVAPMRTLLEGWLGPASAGDVLEIGAGSGQHALAFATALPRLTWWPTEAGGEQLASIEAWRRHAGPPNLMAPFALDAAAEDWGLTGPTAGRPPARGLLAIVAVNVLHIAPWAVAEGLFRGAGRHLGDGGMLIFYGPFMRNGSHTAASNAAFDADLRARDPAWGLRDMAALDVLARQQGLRRQATEAMPANNFTLLFTRG